MSFYLKNTNNMSIVTTGYSAENTSILDLNEIKQIITTSSLEESLKQIEAFNGIISDESYRYLISTAYYYSGDIDNAIKELETIEKTLSDQNLVALSDMLLKRGSASDIIKTENLLLSIYKRNKFVKNLFPMFFRLYQNDKPKLYEFIDEALKYDPDDLATIEMNGIRLSALGKHIEASNEFRRLSSVYNYPYYELVARINEIIADEKSKNQDKINYIDEHIQYYPEIKNEAMLRLANYFIQYKQSYFLAYQCLSKASIDRYSKRTQDILKLKIKILKDELKASKALFKLKPYKKDRDAQKLNSERCKVLLESIQVFCCNSKGFLQWRDFLESQSTRSWATNIYSFIKEITDVFVELDIEKMIEQSFVATAEKTKLVEKVDFVKENYETLNANSIKIVRNVFQGKGCDLSFDNFDELFQTIITIPKVTQNLLAEIWGTYYLSLIASMRGYGQRANEPVLTLFDFIDRVDKDKQELCQCLGLIAWGNSQYRAGRKFEGISCMIVALKLTVNLNDPFAIVETGFNVIGRYLIDECSDEFYRDITYWKTVNTKIAGANAFFSFLCNGSEEGLLKKIEKCEEKDAEWAGDVINLISLNLKKKSFVEALSLLEKYSDEALNYLQNRKDILFHVLYNWANSYLLTIEYGGINNLYKAASLSDRAIKELEEFRYSYSHKEERAGFGNLSLEIYKNHIAIYGLLFEEQRDNDLGLYFKEQILSVVHNILPRSMLEQKQYFHEFELTEELKELQNQYYKSILEYNEMARKRLNCIDEMSCKAKHIISLEKELKEKHPHYAALKRSAPIDFDRVSTNLNGNELCFQYVITFLGVLTILTGKDNVELYFDKCDTFQLQKNIDEFSCCIQQDCLKAKIEGIAESISNVLLVRLQQKLKQIPSARLYCISDFNGKLFPIVALKNSDYSVLGNVSSIINIVDYEVLIYRHSDFKINGIFNKVIGKKEDPQITKWIKWLATNKSDIFYRRELLRRLIRFS